LNEDFGLDWYDYGARWYDAAIGRFSTIDRFAEKYSSMSGYGYAAGNPIGAYPHI
jgi:RHS repeat-associated protein